jgi:hypothetical protein
VTDDLFDLSFEFETVVIGRAGLRFLCFAPCGFSGVVRLVIERHGR